MFESINYVFHFIKFHHNNLYLQGGRTLDTRGHIPIVYVDVRSEQRKLEPKDPLPLNKGYQVFLYHLGKYENLFKICTSEKLFLSRK